MSNSREERQKHIKTLTELKGYYDSLIQCESYYDGTLKDKSKALEFAIDSIKVDLAYDLEYEHLPYITVDELKEIQQEIGNYKLFSTELDDMDEDSVKWGLSIAFDILDKKISELEGKNV